MPDKPFDPEGVRQIQPGQLAALGENFEIIADADPEKFPHGLQLVIMAPGQMQPLGIYTLTPGGMVARIPNNMAAGVRPHMRKMLETIQAGKVAAPGFD